MEREMRVRPILSCVLLLALSGTSVAQTTPCNEPTAQSLTSSDADHDHSSVDDNYNINDNAYIMPGRCGVKRDPYARTMGGGMGMMGAGMEPEVASETDVVIPY
jgi:hypothetical protein